MNPVQAVCAFSALAQHSRLAVLRLLVRRGSKGLCAGELARQVGIAPATLSFHLKALVEARLVRARPRGRFVVYRADVDRIRSLTHYLTETCCNGNAAQCFDNLAGAPVRQSITEG